MDRYNLSNEIPVLNQYPFRPLEQCSTEIYIWSLFCTPVLVHISLHTEAYSFATQNCWQQQSRWQLLDNSCSKLGLWRNYYVIVFVAVVADYLILSVISQVFTECMAAKWRMKNAQNEPMTRERPTHEIRCTERNTKITKKIYKEKWQMFALTSAMWHIDYAYLRLRIHMNI